MSTTRRVLVAVGAPLVLVLGLGTLWGWRNAATLKAQIETWADSLEHSSNPVTMELSFLPMYVEGDKIGKLQAVVVQRAEPATVDSLTLVIDLSDEANADELASCYFHLDPDAIDREGPMGYKEAIHCLHDPGDLVRFGSVEFAGTGQHSGLYLEMKDLPCDHMSHDVEGPCFEFVDEIQRIKAEIRSEVRNIRMEIRNEVRQNARVRVKN
jgi:DNA relaxase NicK